MNRSFQNKVVVVTGGASGIGAELVKQLAQLGASVTSIDRDEARGERAVAELRAKGYAVTFTTADMASATAAETAFGQVVREFGRIDYAFNNAGVFLGGEIRDTPLEDWHAVTHNNVLAVMNGTHFAYQAMLEQGRGHIINTGSAAGLMPVPVMGIYGATKYAVVGLSHALRLEAKAFGVRVSVVCPSLVNTPLYDTATYHRLDKASALKPRGHLQTPDVTARRILAGVRRNRATIHPSFSGRVGWWTVRLAPWLYDFAAQRTIRAYRKTLRRQD